MVNPPVTPHPSAPVKRKLPIRFWYWVKNQIAIRFKDWVKKHWKGAFKAGIVAFLQNALFYVMPWIFRAVPLALAKKKAAEMEAKRSQRVDTEKSSD